VRKCNSSVGASETSSKKGAAEEKAESFLCWHGLMVAEASNMTDQKIKLSF